MISKKQPAPAGDLHVNKLYQALLHFDSGERKRFVKYLHSPYFNQSKTLTRLGEMLVLEAESSQAGFNRFVVWRKLFGQETYDDVNFRKYCSDLLKIAEEFMAREADGRDETKMAISTIDFVVQRKMEPLFKGTFRQARRMLDKQPYRSVDYYYHAYSIERQYYYMMDFDVKVDVRANMEEISYNLDLFYWIEKLKLYSAVLSQRKTGNHRYELKFIQEIVQYLQQFPIEEVPELAIQYYSFLTLYEEDQVDHYYNLRRLLDEYGAVMPKEEAIDLFDSALHYCTGKLNKGNRVFLQEYFDLFELAILKSIFLVNGELASWRFNNMIGVALRLGKLDWAENFIQEFKGYLPPDTRDNTFAFNLARVYRYQGKYDKVLDLLKNLEYEDIGYNLISKMMLVITYYELDEHDALDSFMESFRVFLNRHKNISEPLRQSFLNLLKYTRRLGRIMPHNKNAIIQLKQEILDGKAGIANHEWLLEKLAELDG